MNKFFKIDVRPTLTFAERHQVFADGDLIVDWFAFDIPNGANNLVSAYMLCETAAGTIQTFHPEIIFAKDIVVGNKILAPTSLATSAGAPGSAVLGGTFNNQILGFLQAEENVQTTTNFPNSHVARLSTINKNGNRPDLILQGEPDTGTTTGLSRIYVGITAADGDPDFRCSVQTNGGGTAGDATLTVDTAHAARVLSVGDQLVDVDEQEIGTVESINEAGTVITFDKNGLLNTIANNKAIGAKSPIKLVLGFER